jgi:hypothetical protein
MHVHMPVCVLVFTAAHTGQGVCALHPPSPRHVLTLAALLHDDSMAHALRFTFCELASHKGPHPWPLLWHLLFTAVCTGTVCARCPPCSPSSPPSSCASLLA